MNNKYYMPCSVLKKYAREQINDKLGTVIGAFLLQLMCIFPATFLTSSTDTQKISGLVLYYIFAVVVGLYSSIYLYGEDFLYLKAASGGECRVVDIFEGFRDGKILQIISLRIIPVAVAKLSAIPYIIVAIKMTTIMPSNQELITIMQKNDVEAMDEIINIIMPVYGQFILAVLLFVVCTVAVETIFSQVLFIALDYPELSAKEVLKRNLAIMKGSYGRYVYMWLSFIPWYILSAFTCGLSLLWSNPYMWATKTNFYLDLARKNKDIGGN